MTFAIKAKVRKLFGKQLKAARQDSQVPAVVYGPEVKENINLFLDFNTITKLYFEAGESSMIELSVEGEDKPREVIIKEVIFEPVKNVISHVDFYQFKKGQKLDIDVDLEFVGESSAVKNLGGTLVTNLNFIPVRCLPRNMVSSIKVDISKLETFDDRIAVKDLNLPETLEYLGDLDESVALVVAPREEKEEAPVAEDEEKSTEEKEVKEGEGKDQNQAKDSDSGQAADSKKE